MWTLDGPVVPKPARARTLLRAARYPQRTQPLLQCAGDTAQGALASGRPSSGDRHRWLESRGRMRGRNRLRLGRRCVRAPCQLPL